MMIIFVLFLDWLLRTHATPGTMTCPSMGQFTYAAETTEVKCEVIGSANVDGDGALEVQLNAGGDFTQGGRSYLGNKCLSEKYYNPDYFESLKLLGKILSWDVDLSGAGCGCNVGFTLAPMRENSHHGTCGDYYCDGDEKAHRRKGV